MLQIAICDPNILHRNAFCDTLAKLLFDAADYSFSCFGNAEDLLARLQDAAFFQLVFLEIHLDGPMNGLEAADRIRSLSPDTDIIFLTDAAEYVTEGYRYHAFDFLIKPVPLARLQDVVSRYLSERRKRPADFLNVTIQRCSIQLPLYQIYYLESFTRFITWKASCGRSSRIRGKIPRNFTTGSTTWRRCSPIPASSAATRATW